MTDRTDSTTGRRKKIWPFRKTNEGAVLVQAGALPYAFCLRNAELSLADGSEAFASACTGEESAAVKVNYRRRAGNSDERGQAAADGSCLGNPVPGGWACILQCGGRERVLHGNAAFTTNNRTELTAGVRRIAALTRPCVITVFTDSEYVRRGITEFLPRWRSGGWRNLAGKPVLNAS